MKTWHYILIAVIIVIVVALLLFKKDIQALVTKPQTQPTATPPTPPAPLDYNKSLFKGVHDAKPEVKKLQELLGVTVDGDFGPQTEAALKARKGVLQTTLNIYMTLADQTNGATGDYTETSFLDTFSNLFQNGVNSTIQWIS